jgi:hypothetical protein
VTTDEYGTFTYPFNVTPDTFAGLNTLNATYIPAANDVFLGSSAGTFFNVTALDTKLTLNSSADTYALGDIAGVNGTLTSSDGSPLAGVNVMVTLGNVVSENFTTNSNGIFNGLLNIPYNIAADNYSLYAAYEPSPGGSLNASSVGPINIDLIDSGRKVVVQGMTPLLFMGEDLNVTGTITTGRGMPIAGYSLNSSLNGVGVAIVNTTGRGDFNIPAILTGNDAPGFYSLTISDANTSAIIYSGSVLLIPVNLYTAAGIIAIILAILAVGTAWIFTARRRKELPPAPVAAIAVPQDSPAPVFNLDSELWAVKVPARQGDLKAAFTGIYLVVKKLISLQGIEVKDSMTHAEFYGLAAKSLPAISAPLGRIVSDYEKAIYSGETVTMSEFDSAVGDIREIYDSLRGEG